MKTWRSWPWTLALAGVLGGFALLGLVGIGLRTSGLEVAISLVVTAAAFVGMLRVLATGVRSTPSGVIIRDLTRTTMIAWTDVRKVSMAPGERRGVHVPVLKMGPARSVKGGPRTARTGPREDIPITVLGSYKAAVAQRRADELEAARVEATRRTR